MGRRFWHPLLLALGLLVAFAWVPAPQQASAGAVEQRFDVANSFLHDYYQKRGGVRTFGYPISREFTLRGYRVQLFQRGALQLLPGGGVATLNLLDEEIMPYSSFNFTRVPLPDPSLKVAAPATSDPDYAKKAIEFIQANVPDEWEGMQVNFLSTFLTTIRYEDAFPTGVGEPALVPLLNLEYWGLPTSRPAYDPNNHSFAYQRFQRGIMHYDEATGKTQGILLGDYFKAILTGAGLPLDLEASAASSPFYRQYDLGSHQGPLRPVALPGSNLNGAFRAAVGDSRFGVVMIGPRTEDPAYVSAGLSALGAEGWYGFSGNAPATADRVELVRPNANLAEIGNLAKANQGTAWMIGNEPNVPEQDGLDPEAYSDFLFEVASVLRGADPTAVLVGPNVLNWDATCNLCSGYDEGRTWSEAFVSAYEKKHGKIPLNVWGIHTYTLDWDALPMANAAADQAQLIRNGAWLKERGMSMPIWLTEFGVIWGYDSIDWDVQHGNVIAMPAGNYRNDVVGSYMDSMLGWLTQKGSSYGVDRWFLYASSPWPEPFATTAAGITLLKPGQLVLTDSGEKYRRWATGTR